jgi:hypothetical protein
MRDRLMVGHRPLKPRIGVRVPVPQVLMNEMNRRLGGGDIYGYPANLGK